MTAYAGEDLGQRKHSSTGGRSANFYSHFGSQYSDFLENRESVYHSPTGYAPKICLIIPKEHFLKHIHNAFTFQCKNSEYKYLHSDYIWHYSLDFKVPSKWKHFIQRSKGDRQVKQTERDISRNRKLEDPGQ